MLKEMMDLTNRKILITGALGGLGQIISKTIAELGGDLILVDRPESNFDPLKNQLSVDVQCIGCDLESPQERYNLVKLVNKDSAGLNVLINNAAFVGDSELDGWSVDFEDQTLGAWKRAMEVNLTAVFDLSKLLTPLLKKSPGANIINIASIYGVCGPDWRLYKETQMGNPAAYSASKGGLIQLTRWLATTLAPSIRVNSISPGGIYRSQPEQFVEKYNARTPLARMASERDFCGVVAFLASDLSEYVTGENINVDGGWCAW